MTVEVCPICDIAGCKHIRERTHPMTHDTPPKRIWMTHEDHGASWSGAYRAFRCSDLDHSNDDGPNPEYPEYTLTSEAEAMVAAALRGAAAHGDAWIAVFGDVEIKHTPANAYAADAVLDYQDAILALIPQPASAALDKLIAEAVAAERAIWTQAIETHFDATAVEDVEQHVAAIRAALSAAPTTIEPSSTSETHAQAEDRICSCGAGHGSLEGHLDWCDWISYLALPTAPIKEESYDWRSRGTKTEDGYNG